MGETSAFLPDELNPLYTWKQKFLREQDNSKYLRQMSVKIKTHATCSDTILVSALKACTQTGRHFHRQFHPVPAAVPKCFYRHSHPQ